MVTLIVVITVVVFILVDFALRLTMENYKKKKIAREREEALDKGLKLDYTEEAATLKRVEVPEPKAKILAVDDEEIILDSFRKILVLEGYSVDTVEHGEEALGLIKKHDYDFVFTDLKMPGMNGVEVTKAVKHLRPDIDVIVITGYATIETAVETMKVGAMDYVQKPFSEDELIEFVRKFVIRRQDKIQKQMRPKLRLLTHSEKESKAKNEFNVPAGIFVSSNHTWVKLEMDGTAKVGLDDFLRKTIVKFSEFSRASIGDVVKKNDFLFSFRAHDKTFDVHSPISGKVILINEEHIEHPEWFSVRPFELSWVCCIEPADISSELTELKIGGKAVDWYEKEIEKYENLALEPEGNNESPSEGDEKSEEQKYWEIFSKTFLSQKIN